MFDVLNNLCSLIVPLVSNQTHRHLVIKLWDIEGCIYVIEQIWKHRVNPRPHFGHFSETHWLWDEGTGGAKMLIYGYVLGLISVVPFTVDIAHLYFRQCTSVTLILCVNKSPRHVMLAKKSY